MTSRPPVNLFTSLSAATAYTLNAAVLENSSYGILTLPMPKGRGFLGSHSYRSEIHQAIPVCPTVQLAMPTAEVLLAQY